MDAEEIYQMKKQLKNLVLGGFKVAVDDDLILRHYFETQDSFSHDLQKAMGWING